MGYGKPGSKSSVDVEASMCAHIVDLISLSQFGIRGAQRFQTSFWSKSLSLSPKFPFVALPNVYSR
jgi:hypothetical protein